MSGFLRILVVALAALTGSASTSTTTASAATFTYDVLTVARFEIHQIEDGEAAPALPGDSQEGSASHPIAPHGRSTTRLTPVVATNTVDDVIAETTNAATRNLTSAHTLTADEALDAGQRWVGDGYTELGKPGSGVFRSADGTRQFRIDDGSLTGAHAPGVPHVHLETYAPGARIPSVNNHIPFVN